MSGSEIFRQIDEAATRDDVLDVLAEFYRARGFRSFCFVIPMVTKPDQFRLYERGMPPEWMRRYLERDFDLIDPVSTAATTRNKVGTLGELLKQLTVNDVGRLFVEEATRMGLTDGLAIPTSGLRHARGFFGVDNVAAGKSNPETAMILGISEATVGTHLKRLFTKLGVHDRVSAVLAGFKLGMLR